LHEFCATEHSTENIEVWQQIQDDLQKCKDSKLSTRNHSADKLLVESYSALYESSLKTDSKNQVNIPSALIIKCKDLYNRLQNNNNSANPSEELMNEICSILVLVQDELCRLLNTDTLARFKRSPQCIRYLNQEPIMFTKRSITASNAPFDKKLSKNRYSVVTDLSQLESSQRLSIKSNNNYSIQIHPQRKDSFIKPSNELN